MVRQCQVCRKMDYLHPTLTFHRFPADGDRLKMWIKLLQFHDKVLPKKPEICSDHFRTEDFEYKSNGVKYLKKNACPKPPAQADDSPLWNCFPEQGTCPSTLPSPSTDKEKPVLDMQLEGPPSETRYDLKNMNDHSYCLPGDGETAEESYQHLMDGLKLDLDDLKYELELEDFKFDNEDFSVKASMEDLAEDQKVEFYFIEDHPSEAETSAFTPFSKCDFDTDVSKFFSADDDDIRTTEVPSVSVDSNSNKCNNEADDKENGNRIDSPERLPDERVNCERPLLTNMGRKNDNINLIDAYLDGQSDIDASDNYEINDLIATDNEANVINNNADCEEMLQALQMNGMF